MNGMKTVLLLGGMSGVLLFIGQAFGGSSGLVMALGGALLMNFGQTGDKEGDFWLPAGIAIDARNRIYVADTYNQRVAVFQFLGEPKTP